MSVIYYSIDKLFNQKNHILFEENFMTCIVQLRSILGKKY